MTFVVCWQFQLIRSQLLFARFNQLLWRRIFIWNSKNFQSVSLRFRHVVNWFISCCLQTTSFNSYINFKFTFKQSFQAFTNSEIDISVFDALFVVFSKNDANDTNQKNIDILKIKTQNKNSNSINDKQSKFFFESKSIIFSNELNELAIVDLTQIVLSATLNLTQNKQRFLSHDDDDDKSSILNKWICQHDWREISIVIESFSNDVFSKIKIDKTFASFHFAKFFKFSQSRKFTKKIARNTFTRQFNFRSTEFIEKNQFDWLNSRRLNWINEKNWWKNWTRD